MATANRHIYIQSENTNLMELSLYSWPPVYFVFDSANLFMLNEKQF